MPAPSVLAHRHVGHQIEDGEARPVTYAGTLLKADGTMTGRRLAALIGLRDHARRVLQCQNEGWPEIERQRARRNLNVYYDLFANVYGPINKTTFSKNADGTLIRRMPNVAKFREDPDAMPVMSLEEYDEVTGKATKAAVLQKDVVGRTPEITSVASGRLPLACLKLSQSSRPCRSEATANTCGGRSAMTPGSSAYFRAAPRSWLQGQSAWTLEYWLPVSHAASDRPTLPLTAAQSIGRPVLPSALSDVSTTNPSSVYLRVPGRSGKLSCEAPDLFGLPNRP